MFSTERGKTEEKKKKKKGEGLLAIFNNDW